MPEAVIVATARSPIGRAVKGSLSELRPDDLAATIVDAALRKVPQLDRTLIEDLYLGCGLPGGEQGFNMARVVATMLGLDGLPGATVTRYCSAPCRPPGWRSTRSRPARATSSSRPASRRCPASPAAAPTGCRRRRRRWSAAAGRTRKFAEAEARTADSATNGGVWHDPREDGKIPDIYIAMGQTAENLAQVKNVTREDMDEFGVRSQNLAEKAIADGFWEREITPVTLPDGRVVSFDDGPRSGVTMEAVSQLKPVFRPDGRVTAGNCCPLNDGAAAVGRDERYQGARARHHAAGPDRLHRRDRAQPGDHGPGSGSRRRGKHSSGPA
jgi:acetyl-CoA C-acetyltransferase